MPYNYDPDLVDFVAMLPQMSFADIAGMRGGMQGFSEQFKAAVDVSRLHVKDQFIPGPEGAPPVLVRVYTPRQRSAIVAGLLYIHGGGFAVGSIDSEHASAALLADQLGIVVVSVEYRLAPEHPYPAPLDDCYAALCWLHAGANELGIDSARIGVFGQSAGGGLAAGLALLTRDRKGPPLCFQFLGMPELDDRLDTTSMRTFTDTPLWSRPSAILSWKYYLGDQCEPGSADVPVYAAPARATQLQGLPPAYISAMEFDPLRDEDILYALKLMEAGVPVELHTFPGTFHGSVLLAQAAVTVRQQSEMLDVLRRGLRISR
jgi:acetyl esterase